MLLRTLRVQFKYVFLKIRSPDGTCILTNSDDSILRIFDTNAQMLNSEENPIANEIVFRIKNKL